MLIGVLRLELFIPSALSLKEKRMVLKSLKDRLRNSFNISVAEVDNEDKWQRSTLALAAVSSDKRYLNGQLDRAADLVENFRGVEVSRREMEFC